MTETVRSQAQPRGPRIRWPKDLMGQIGVLAVLAGLLIGWELAVVLLDISPLTLAKPSAIFRALVNGFRTGIFWPHIATTVTEMVSGFFIGGGLGILLGIVVTEFGRVGRLIFPYLVALQSLPKVAIAPLIIMWAGFGIESKIVVVTLITFFPVLINTISGLTIVDQMRVDLMDVLRANRWQTFLYVRLPTAAPQIFAGLNVAAVMALTGAIVAEFVGAQSGLGVLLLQAQSNLDTPGLFAVLILLAGIGLLANLIITKTEKRALYWVDRRKQGNI